MGGRDNRSLVSLALPFPACLLGFRGFSLPPALPSASLAEKGKAAEVQSLDWVFERQKVAHADGWHTAHLR